MAAVHALPPTTDGNPRPPEKQANLVRFTAELEVSYQLYCPESISLTISLSKVSPIRGTSTSWPYKAILVERDSSII
jgi:hypothetical protein